MNCSRRALFFLAAFCLIALPASSAVADTLTIGALSYDSGLAADGKNTFDLSNYTGNFLGTADSVVDAELFSGSLKVTFNGGSTQTFNFSGIDLNGGTLGEVDPAASVLSATLLLTVSNTAAVNILDAQGNAATVNLSSQSSLVLAGAGPLPACDTNGDPCAAGMGVVTVDTAPAVAVTPEPGSVWLLATGVAGMVSARVRGRILRKT